MRLLLTALLLPALAACGGDTETNSADAPPAQEPKTSACEQAVAKAASVGDMEDTHADMWPAFEACSDLAELTAATEKYPAALDGIDAATYAGNQCAYEPKVADSAVCKSLG